MTAYYILVPLCGALLITIALLYRRWRQMTVLTKLMRESHHRLIKERKVILDFLHDLGEAFTENISIHEILEMVVKCALRVTGANSGAVFLVNRDHQTLRAEVVVGPFPPPISSEGIQADPEDKEAFCIKHLKSHHIKIGESLIGQVARDGQAQLILEGRNHPLIPKPPLPFLEIKSIIVVPLKFRDGILGVLAVANKAKDQSFDENDFSMLNSLSDQAAVSLHNAAVYQMQTEQQTYERDLKLAQDIQHILLPKDFPPIPKYDLFALNHPAQEVGGDYFDFIKIGGRKIGLVIADVSGKGVSGALVMAMFRSALRSRAFGQPSPAEVLNQVNAALFPDMREDLFITVTYMLLDPARNELKIARAGHDPILYYQSQAQSIELIQSQGMAVGMDDGSLFNNVIQEKVLILKPGDMVVLYTDGITETLDPQGNEFGRARLCDVIKANASKSAEAIVDATIELVTEFSGGAPQNDDMTMLVLKKKA